MSNEPWEKLARRDFLAAGIGATVGTLLAPTELAALNSQTTSEPFTQPPVEVSTKGVLQTQLRVVQADLAIPGGRPLIAARCYNGAVTGPTLKLRPGEQLRLKVRNELSATTEVCSKEHINQPHCFNTTNVHTHGLHVSPQGSSDNTFTRIGPQAEFDYCIQLPSNHPAGTFWYHPHVHCSTGLQVMNGMSGALIVEEPAEEKLVSEDSDVIWLVQELMGVGAEKLYSCLHPHAPYTVNGSFQPTLKMRPGEVQRWRFINASATPGGYMDLQLVDSRNRRQQFMVIATDGYPLRRRLRSTSYVLPPGGRVDLLVQLRAPGKYRMFKRRFQGQAQDQVLAWIDSSGRQLNATLPGTLRRLPEFLRPISDQEIVNRRVVRFQICPDQARGDVCKGYPDAKLCKGQNENELLANAFLIDGKPYDLDRVDHTVKLGTAEEWEIVNETGAEHPFHIHQNHFQVVQRGVAPAYWPWRDTVSMPSERSIKIRTRFLDYPGKFVLHCHILLHSDLGMMQNVEVVGEGRGPCAAA